MVKDLFDTAAPDKMLKSLISVTDVDSGQRAEIKIMQNMLGEKPQEEKQ
jgi:hypothetical protein